MRTTLAPSRSVCFACARRPAFVLAGALLTALAASAQAQLPQTRLLSVFPPGAKAGASVEVAITNGTDLEEIDAMVFNHAGIKAVPKTQDQGGKPVPVANTFVVTVDGNVAPGIYEARVRGLWGMSNPRTFVVSDRDEIQEIEPNNAPEQATPMALGQIVNARSNGATDVDWYKFDGKKGQRVLADVRAARIDSRMSPVVALFTPGGRQLGFARNQVRGDALLDITLPEDGPYLAKVYDFVYGGSNDHFYRLSIGTAPYIDFVFPPSGTPGSNGQFTLYGRNLPGGAPAGISIEGRPLEKLAVQIPLPSDPATWDVGQNVAPVEAVSDAIHYVLRTPVGASNSVPIRFATAPVIAEVEPNDVPAKAQKIAVPAEVVGQFQSRGDVDYTSFDAKSGEVYFIEVFGERDGSPADPYLTLDRVQKNDKGEETVNRITALDDDATNLLANVFDTKTDDVIYKFQVPADGEYRVSVRDRYYEVHGDPRMVYRLSIRREAPDFRVAAVPLMPAANPQQAQQQGVQTWALGLRRGDTNGVMVLAFRRDGFNGPIDVMAEGLPEGVTCKGATIGPNQTSVLLMLSAAENAQPWAGPIRVVGKARLDNPEKEREVARVKGTVKPAADAIPKFEQAAAKAADDFKKATEAFAKAKEAADKDAANKGLQDQAAAAQKVVDTATAAQKKAQDELAGGKKALADAEAAVKAAEDALKAASREVARIARSGTVVWNGAQNLPGVTRVSQSLELSVMKEAATYQVTIAPESNRIDAGQGRVILLPVKLLKRNGFDNNVTLTFEGLPPNTNIAVENKPINKGKDDELLKITLAPNAVPGTYTLWLRSAVQVPYVRNPEKLERVKKEQEAANKVAIDAAEVLKKATADKDAAAKKAADDAEALKKAQAAKTEADKKAAAAQDAIKNATAAKEKADKDGDAAAKAAAAKGLTDAQEAAKKAADEATVATKASTDAEAAAKVSAEAKTKAEAVATDADTKNKAAVAAKQAADKLVTDTANVVKPNNVNIASPSEQIVINVKPAPATLAATVANNGAVKRGANLEVKVAVNRVNGFTGPVTLGLALPPGVAGLSADAVTVAPDQKEGTLVVKASGEATEGQLANVFVTGAAEFNGKVTVNAAVNVKVDK